jgi:rhomboid family GlyGly-CTERM serine protease
LKAQVLLVSQARRLICPLAISLVSLSISLASNATSEQLQYHRIAIAAGEWWRLLSAHLTHLGWGHLLMNLAGLWIIWHLFPNRQQPNGCLYILPLLMIGTSIGLWFFSPEVAWYQGLSGVLHGLLIIVLLQNIKTETMLSISLLLAVIAKLAWEQWQGPLPGSESVASGRVIVDAHLYGALSGAILWAIERLLGLER